ncbi:methyltransferase domain-containing protein [Paenibacillus sp. BC26]|uniref:methyltransferase domain-containing protein n=1 Tax=Paenibacillus sp. BC26 TaxID=1881032 RepID=UPI0008ED90B3|nr:methyltransferase domain-containing protein [Paenibacillus sp. BC26]SFT09647.1 Ubiquinone/menaquinone biosynthesis C-methylase UbiE [Paenibacillus sp. BC26]
MIERNSTYDIEKAVLGYTGEMARLQVQVLMGWEKEFRNLQWFGLQDGMRILEVGSGPGFFTEQLVGQVPQSTITALEVDSTLLNEARNRLVPRFASQLEFVHASVYDSGLPDHSYDFVIARLLFLHLKDPLAAAGELSRVLKPGGKLVIIDVDDGIFGALHPDLPVLPSVLRKVADYVAWNGGNRLIGRSLPRLLRQAGFTDVDMDSILQHSDLLGIEGFRYQFDIRRFMGLCQKGVITQEELDQMKQASEKLNNSSEAYAMMNFVMACGTKPRT